MSSHRTGRDREIVAEAAWWLARLRSDARDVREEPAGFRAWLESDARHRLTFDEMTTRWDAAALVDRAAFEHGEEKGRGRRRLLVPAGAMAVVVALLVPLVMMLLRPEAPAPVITHATPIGGQAELRLADGSLLLLDADSAVTVAFTADARRLMLERGQIRLDVAHDPRRRFVVEAGRLDVAALGTAFDVSREAGRESVTLLRGSVMVTQEGGGIRPLVLAPGQRLTDRNGKATLDRPDPGDIEAWRKGIILFDDDSLGEAIAVMNRHAARPLRLRGTALAGRHISGAYRARDTEAFARTVGLLLSVPVTVETDAIVIG